MHYLKHYIRMMRRAEQRPTPDAYTEKHHIFPRAIFGDNNRVVALTAREHFIAHLLLWKHYASRGGGWRRDKMALAAFMMRNANNEKLNSHLYQTLREHHSAAMATAQQGRKHSEESKRKRSEKMSGRPKSAEHREATGNAMRGMLMWNNGERNTRARECPGEGWVRGVIKKGGWKRKPHSDETRAKMSKNAGWRKRQRTSDGRWGAS